MVDNTLLDLQNSSYPTQPLSIIANFSNKGAIYTKGLLLWDRFSPFRLLLSVEDYM